jgi:hypothetical protein
VFNLFNMPGDAQAIAGLNEEELRNEHLAPERRKQCALARRLCDREFGRFPRPARRRRPNADLKSSFDDSQGKCDDIREDN